MTSEQDRGTLLDLARRAVETGARGEHQPIRELLPSDCPQPEGSGGAFVTLKKNGALRGCIGHLRSQAPIAETVADMARAAAFEDPRFPPVSTEEVGSLDIEISRLSAFFPIAVENVEVGVHGLLIRRGFRSGLLLPQVPGEQGWDRAAYLSGLCRKAGLPDGSWAAADAELQAFTAEVFSETD